MSNIGGYFELELNTLHYINGQSCPVSESVAKRVFCIPLYHDLTVAEQQLIAQIILNKHK